MPPFTDRIAAAHDQYSIGAGAERCHRTMAMQMGLLAQMQLYVPSDVAAAKHAVYVTVNDGRWVIVCPDCNEGQVAAKDDARFCCWQCKNVMVEGKWRPVLWPDDVAGIERELLKREKLRTRNWRPGETVADLAVEALNNARPSIPRPEDLDERDRLRVAAAFESNAPGEPLPVVEWADDERTVPKVTYPKKGKS